MSYPSMMPVILTESGIVSIVFGWCVFVHCLWNCLKNLNLIYSVCYYLSVPICESMCVCVCLFVSVCEQ